jgi:hypothetical protein
MEGRIAGYYFIKDIELKDNLTQAGMGINQSNPHSTVFLSYIQCIATVKFYEKSFFSTACWGSEINIAYDREFK